MSKSIVFATACLTFALGTVASTMAGEQLRQRPDRPDRDRPGYGDRGPGAGDRDRDRAGPGYGDGRDDERRYGPGDWELIGEAKIVPRVERHVIDIDPEAGRVGRIGLKIQDSDIELIDVEIRYLNGEKQTVPMRQVIKAGGQSTVIELTGEARRIENVAVSYIPRGPVKLSLFGEPARRLRPGARWEPLGCQKVGFLDDKDVIRVGRDDGRFRAIKLTVDGNKVRLVRLRVVYANGQAEDLAVRTVIPEGTETRPFELTGRRRGIERIELQYLPQLNFGGRASVCAYGM